MSTTIATELLTEIETAKMLRINRQTLAKWRCEKSQPALAYVRVGRAIRYPRTAVIRFIEGNTVGAEN